MAGASVKFEIELAGIGGGWTDISADLMDGAELSYGISGSSIVDRVASTGTITVLLNNAASNSGGVVGYYSPGHANCRSGFALSARVRLTLTDPATAIAQVRFVGTSISKIDPVAGSYGRQVVSVTADDWMNEAALAVLTDATLQVNALSSAVITAIVATMTRQPLSTSIATGRDTFPYALDSANASVLAEISKVTLSEFGYAYLKGTGQFVFEKRFGRANTASAVTFTNTMAGLTVDSDMGNLQTSVKTTVHPRRADASVVTLWTLNAAFPINPGATSTIKVDFSDPSQRAVKVGAWSLNTVTATTDYLANSASDGTGSNMTGTTSVVATAQGGGGVELAITNSAATICYITFLQQRGKALYDYGEASAFVSDAALVSAHGDRLLDVNLPYQSSAGFGKQLADYLVGLAGPTNARTATISLVPATNALQTQIITRDVGDRITVVETVTGTSADFYINRISMSIVASGFVTATWGLVLADATAYWALGTVGFSELGNTTTLSF